MTKRTGLAIAAAAAIGLLTAGQANAVPSATGAPSAASAIETVQYRHGHDWHGGSRNSWGRGVGPFIGGLATGAIIGGAITGRRYYDDGYYGRSYYDDGYSGGGGDDAYARCAARFRSFDPSTGTYTSYAGETVVCPYLR